MIEKEIDGWRVRIGRSAMGGWLAIADRDGIELAERGRLRKHVSEAIEYAIELEMSNPWWRLKSQSEPHGA